MVSGIEYKKIPNKKVTITLLTQYNSSYMVDYYDGVCSYGYSQNASIFHLDTYSGVSVSYPVANILRITMEDSDYDQFLKFQEKK